LTPAHWSVPGVQPATKSWPKTGSVEPPGVVGSTAGHYSAHQPMLLLWVETVSVPIWPVWKPLPEPSRSQ
jgi:hypothetical protein